MKSQSKNVRSIGKSSDSRFDFSYLYLLWFYITEKVYIQYYTNNNFFSQFGLIGAFSV